MHFTLEPNSTKNIKLTADEKLGTQGKESNPRILIGGTNTVTSFLLQKKYDLDDLRNFPHTVHSLNLKNVTLVPPMTGARYRNEIRNTRKFIGRLHVLETDICVRSGDLGGNHV